MFISILFLSLISIALYNRYVPVRNIPCKTMQKKEFDAAILDIRDYNEAKDTPDESIHVPYGYLRRFWKEISFQHIHVIASNQIELNLGLRYLLKKGFTVMSYEIADCPCKRRNGGPNHGV